MDPEQHSGVMVYIVPQWQIYVNAYLSVTLNTICSYLFNDMLILKKDRHTKSKAGIT